MKYSGTIKAGVVVLEGSPPLKEGTSVLVEEAPKEKTLGQKFKEFSGAAKNLPSDMARNHDHYLHGRPKK